MQQTPPQLLNLAIALAALAGLVDVLAFLSLGGFFASFMSGNSTRLAIGVAANWYDAMLAASLIGAFVAGVIGGTLLGRRAGQRRHLAIMMLVTALLILCGAIAVAGQSSPLLLLAAAMGATNTMFERDGEVAIGLTYMTGTLVRLGQNLARWIVGAGTLDGWMRHLMLWSGFLAGGLIGVSLYYRIGLTSLWVAALIAAGITALLAWAERPKPAARLAQQQQDDPDQDRNEA